MNLQNQINYRTEQNEYEIDTEELFNEIKKIVE